MNLKPLISVVIPIYNGEKYVAQCIENILEQSYEHIEIIVINDGSTDTTKEIAEKFPVRLLDLDMNKGLSAARNIGMDAAKGEYIHFMDVDDAINAEFYGEMAKAILATEADVACSGMINEAKRYKTLVYKKDQVVSSVRDKLEITYVGKWGYVWRYLFRLQYLKDQNLRFEEGRFMEDLTFSLPAVYYANKVVAVAGACYNYYSRENSIMTNKDKAHREKRRQDWRHARDFRRDFSKRHNIKIPGIDVGRIGYILRKFLR